MNRSELLMIVMGLFFAAPCYGITIHVSPDGSNEEGDGSRDNPCQTIGYALSVADGSEDDPLTIQLIVGTYSAGINGEEFPLTLESYLVINGAEAETILDATEEGYDPLHLMTGEGLKSLRITRLTVRGANENPEELDDWEDWQPSRGGTIALEDCHDVQISNVHFIGSSGLSVRTENY